ncbi:MAG: peptidoglycan DD-metalloendopeptidase family protein [Lachnospiraceae bacterium]|nr:peptidoglycan DD-metalloendopeptidase family protein [Lachnospiraceae bacterium]
MESKKHKRKTNHVVIVTSDAADASVKQFRISPWVVWLAIAVVCILIGTGLGYLMYEDQIWGMANDKIDVYKQQIEELKKQLTTKDEEAVVKQEAFTAERKEYEKQLAELEEKLEIMGDTVTQKTEEVELLKAEMEVLYNPTLLPLTGGASIEEVSEGEPMCLFTASEGALVVATAGGMVTEIVEEAEYGYKVSVDHGNGYVTIYRNQDEPKVKQGDTIMQGATIFVIDVDNLKIGYQIMHEGIYINPMEMMHIEG